MLLPLLDVACGAGTVHGNCDNCGGQHPCGADASWVRSAWCGLWAVAVNGCQHGPYSPAPGFQLRVPPAHHARGSAGRCSDGIAVATSPAAWLRAVLGGGPFQHDDTHYQSIQRAVVAVG